MASSQIDQHRTGIRINMRPYWTQLEMQGEGGTATLTPANIDDQLKQVLAYIQGSVSGSGVTDIGGASYDYHFIDGVLQWIEFRNVVCVHWLIYAGTDGSGTTVRCFMVLPAGVAAPAFTPRSAWVNKRSPNRTVCPVKIAASAVRYFSSMLVAVVMGRLQQESCDIFSHKMSQLLVFKNTS